MDCRLDASRALAATMRVAANLTPSHTRSWLTMNRYQPSLSVSSIGIVEKRGFATTMGKEE